MRGVIVRDFLLDLDEGGGFVGELRGFHEVSVDLGKIHRGKIELLELENREAFAGFGLGLAPGLADLRAALLLEDAADLRLEAAVDVLLGDADAKEAR